MKDLYSTLEVSQDANQDQIREQYLFLLHAWHPDKFPNYDQKIKAQNRTKEINEAYEVLHDPQKRAAYDKELKRNSTQATEANSLNANSKAIAASVAILSREEAVHWSSRLSRLGFGTTSLDLVQKINSQITTWGYHALYEPDEVEILGSKIHIGTTSKNILKGIFLDQKKPEVWAIRALNKSDEVISGTWEGHMVMTNKRVFSYSSGSKDEQQGVKVHTSLGNLIQMDVERSTFRFLTRKGNRIEIAFNLPRASLGTILESDDDDYSRRKPDIARERQRALDDTADDSRSVLFTIFNEICVRARSLPA